MLFFMAKIGQKFNEYTERYKMQIVNEYLKGENGGSRSLSKKYNISHRTIDTWIYTYKKQGNLNNNTKLRGRKKRPI